MEQVVIQNQELVVTIALKGAEVRSVKNIASNHEYMWSGDSTVWSGVSPVLFPVVGKTTDNRVLFNSSAYPQGNHGFARSAVFNVTKQSASSVSLSIECAPEILNCAYPFKLQFIVSYSLNGKNLITNYTVINNDNQVAYFSVGAHPAFACPFDDKHKISDYVIEFDQPEQLLQHEITSAAFFTGKTTAVALELLPLDEHTFDNDAIVYTGYQSKFISLVELDSGRRIKVSLSGFPWLGLWSKPQANAPYVCIEPWCGHSDMLGFAGELPAKSAIEQVIAGATWQREFSTEFAY